MRDLRRPANAEFAANFASAERRQLLGLQTSLDDGASLGRSAFWAGAAPAVQRAEGGAAAVVAALAITMFGFSSRLALVASSFLATGVRVGSGFILLRLLAPGDYGKVTMVTAATGVVVSLGDFGVYRVVTTRQDLPTDEVLETASLVTIVVFATYAVAAIASGGYFAWQYGEMSMLWIGVIWAAMTVAAGYYGLQTAALARELNFARWARLELVLVFVTAASAIGLAVAGAGVYALALPPLLAQLATALAVPRSPGVIWPRRVNRPMVRSFLGFGWQNAVFQYVNNLPLHLVNLMVGSINAPAATNRQERTEQVGVLGRALSIKTIIGLNFALAVDRVLFPIMCKVQDQPARFADLFVRGCLYIFALLGFAAVTCIATAPDLVRVMCGSAWMSIVPLLQIVVVDLFFMGFSVLAISTVMIYQRPLTAARFGLVQFAVLVPNGLLYHYFGMAVFCAALTASTAATSLWFGMIAARQYGVSRRRLANRLRPAAIAVAAAGLAMAALRIGLLPLWEAPDALWPSLVRLSACGVVGLLVAALVMWWIDRQTFREIQGLLARRTPEPA